MSLLGNPPLWLRLVVIVGLALPLVPALEHVRRGFEANSLINRCFDDYDPDYIKDPVQRAAYCDHPYWRLPFFTVGNR